MNIRFRSVVFLGLLYCLPTKVYTQIQVVRYAPLFQFDKPLYCPGDTVAIQIYYAATILPNGTQTGQRPLNTESRHRDIYNNAYRCTVTEEVVPTVTGSSGSSVQVFNRPGCVGLYYPTVVIKFVISTTTSIRVSWKVQFTDGTVLNGSADYEEQYDSTVVVKVANLSPPTIDAPQQLRINQGNPSPPKIRATGTYVSNITREMRWLKSDCNGNPVTVYQPYFYPPVDYSEYYFDHYTLGTYKIWAQKVEGGCLSQLSPPIEVTVKPCNLSPNSSGCNAAAIDNIENNSCNPVLQSRDDYHFYHREKVICEGQCDMNALWAQYKSSITNQAIVLSDQIPFTGGFSAGMGFSKLLFPQENYDVPLTDCAEVSLPRITTFAIQAGLTSGSPIIIGSSVVPGLIQYACSEMPFSKSDPIFIRVDDYSKCAINYTRPGHILYPGKVTRCLIRECDKVKILTFGEGTTLYPNSLCGKAIGIINQYWGDIMFGNVDERVNQGFHNIVPPPASSAITGPPNQHLINKNWKVKTLQIRYPVSDSIFTFFNSEDTSNFYNLRSINIYFGDSGKYKGVDVSKKIVDGKWAYDSVSQKLFTDTASVSIVSQTDSTFTIKELLPVFKDSAMITAECFFTFHQKDFENTIFTFSGSGSWANASNWVNNLIPPSTITYGTVININPTGTNPECLYTGDLVIEKGGILNVPSGKKLRVTGKLILK